MAVTYPDFAHLGYFKYWCQKVLPCVYDDSLSYYELLCKVSKYLNDTVEVVNLHSDAITELQEMLARWLEGDFTDEILAAAEDYFAQVLGDYVTEEVFNEEMLGKLDNNFPGFWMRYSDSYHNAGWIPELEDWVASGHVGIIFNPGTNTGVVDIRVQFKDANGITAMQRYDDLGFPMADMTMLPIARLNGGAFGPSSGMSFGYLAYWVNSDGTREFGSTGCGLLVDGTVYIVTSPNALFNNGTSTYRSWFIQGTFISPASAELGRYSLQTPQACRSGFVTQAISDEGMFFYKRTGTEDTVYDTRYIDCSGEVWRACNFGAGVPIAAGAGTNQINMGVYVTRALPGEELDVSKMLPGDIVGIGRIGYPRTVYAGTALEDTVVYNEPFEHYYHMAIYLGDNEFMHITNSETGYLFEDGAQVGDVSPWDGNTVLLSPGFTTNAYDSQDGDYKAKGPYKFRGMDKWRMDEHTYDGHTSYATYRMVVRLFPDTSDYLIG